MQAASYVDLIDGVTSMLCPLRLGQAKRECVATKCMAWRYEERSSSGKSIFYGWCGLAGEPKGERFDGK